MYYGSTEDALPRFGKIHRSGSVAGNGGISIHGAIGKPGSICPASSLQHFGSVRQQGEALRLDWKAPYFVIGAIVRLGCIESSGPLTENGDIHTHGSLRSVGDGSGL